MGELIHHDEAERRGEVYDERNQTYLFDLSSDYAVDALVKGNKTRFMNHSRTPNVVPRILRVNGDFRIGFFANKNIKAQTEVSKRSGALQIRLFSSSHGLTQNLLQLFFDYGRMFKTSKHGFGSLEHENDGNDTDAPPSRKKSARRK